MTGATGGGICCQSEQLGPQGDWVHRGNGVNRLFRSTGSMTGAGAMTGPQAIPDEKDVEFTGPAGDLQVSLNTEQRQRHRYAKKILKN